MHTYKLTPIVCLQCIQRKEMIHCLLHLIYLVFILITIKYFKIVENTQLFLQYVPKEQYLPIGCTIMLHYYQAVQRCSYIYYITAHTERKVILHQIPEGSSLMKTAVKKRLCYVKRKKRFFFAYQHTLSNYLGRPKRMAQIRSLHLPLQHFFAKQAQLLWHVQVHYCTQHLLNYQPLQ